MRVGILEKIANSPYEIGHFWPSCWYASYANKAVMSLQVGKLHVVATRWPELIPIFPLEYLSAFSRLDNK